MTRKILFLSLLFLMTACSEITGTVEQIEIPQAQLGYTYTRPADKMKMVFVPAGTFMMGNDENQSTRFGDETPQHKVTLSDYWIDMFPITNSHYAQCVAANACDPPREEGSFRRENYYSNQEFQYYPVIFIDWNDAVRYCQWAGVRLPTEAEWEYAARGPQGHTYPWGNTPPTTALANHNYYQEFKDTTPVNQYPDGKSWVGAYDMAGNVWEFTHDRYAEYAEDEALNPVDLRRGGDKVSKGGSFLETELDIRAAVRNPVRFDFDPEAVFGFRCAAYAVVNP